MADFSAKRRRTGKSEEGLKAALAIVVPRVLRDSFLCSWIVEAADCLSVYRAMSLLSKQFARDFVLNRRFRYAFRRDLAWRFPRLSREMWAAVYYHRLNGEVHRVGGPASIVCYPGYTVTEWRVMGKLHRDGDEPAVVHEYENGHGYTYHYYKNGLRHRDGGKPAVFRSYELAAREYWVDGMRVFE